MSAQIWISGLALLFLTAPVATAAGEQRLEAQLAALAQKLETTLKNDSAFANAKVQIGAFNDIKRQGTNFGQRIEQFLRTALSAPSSIIRRPTSSRAITRTWPRAKPAANDPNYTMQVLRIKAAILDGSGQELISKVIEINDTDDIAAALGLTVQPPFNGGQKARNKSAENALKHPTFVVRNRTQVTDSESSPYAVEVLVKSTPEAAGTPIVPFDMSLLGTGYAERKGLAFADIKTTQFYELRSSTTTTSKPRPPSPSMDSMPSTPSTSMA